MSYQGYINGFEIEISDIKPLALTKQVNDIARLDNRQSNFSNKVTLPFTVKNIRAMKNLFSVGNNSDIPYKQNVFDLIDKISGKHIVYKGWCNVPTTTVKGYEINIYDGIIDFFKSIENKTLTDIGISDLNHIKDIDTIVNSWANTETYKYIIADYNGKLLTATGNLNADYLVPSARISYLFSQVHSYAGYTFSGAVFNTEKYLNFFMTFPKPIPTDEPIVELVSTQTSSYLTGGYWNGGLGGYNSFGYTVNFFPTTFDTVNANNITNSNVITIATAGAYRITIDGSIFFDNAEVKEFSYSANDANGLQLYAGTIDGSINGNVVLNMPIGGTINIYFNTYIVLWGGTVETTLELITGYSANFDEALVDFYAKDFINEIMQHFGLTAFKDKYTNHIEYLTLDEILQNENIIDWSSKFIQKNSEKYAYSNFAQKNNFKYRYNENNLRYNDGAIFVSNENLKDETTIISSKFYTHEQNTINLLGNETNIYKFWEKAIKDNGDVEYKSLSGRYYSLRSTDFTYSSTQTLQSEALGTSDTFTIAPIESYFRLKQQQIIYDNYLSLGSVLENARILDCSFWLNAVDYESFDFKQLIYVRQLSSYYQVNKINNFIPNTPTKIELIEVDYFSELDVPELINYNININSVSYTSCLVTFDITSNIPAGSTIELIPYSLIQDVLGGTVYAPYTTSQILVSLTTPTLTYSFSQLPEMTLGGWKFKIVYRPSLFELVESNLTDVVNLIDSCYIPVAPPTPNLSYLIITGVETISIINNRRLVRITYISDLSITTMPLTLNAAGITPFAIINSNHTIDNTASQNGTIDVELLNGFYTEICKYQLYLTSLGVQSNTAIS